MQFDELFEDIKLWKDISPDFYSETYPSKMERACKFYKVFTRSIVSRVIDVAYRFDDRDVIFVFPVERFFNLCDIIHPKYNLLTFSNIFSRNITSKYSNAKILSNNRMQKGIYQSFKFHDMRYAKKSLDDLISVFDRNRVKLIILGNDWTFFERLCAFAGRELGIPVVTIQHGIYHKSIIDIMEFGKYSNEFWCWSEYVKDNYEKTYGKKHNFIKVVGYPHFLNNDFKFINTDRVLFISSPWQYENRAICSEYEMTIEKVLDACQILGKKFVFRPHPGEDINYWEKRFSYRDDFNISTGVGFADDVNRSGVLIGDCSSGLLEANMLHRRAIQVVWHEEIKKLAYDELYNSLIKAENSVDDIACAISDNIGKYYEGDEISYMVGESDIFETRIKECIMNIMNSNDVRSC